MSSRIKIRRFLLLSSAFILHPFSILLPSAFCLLPFYTFILSTAPLAAQRPTDVKIAEVRFTREKPRIGGPNWLVTEIRLDVRNNSDRTAVNRQFLDDIQLYVALAHNTGTRSKPVLEYYWSQVEVATLERGSHHFRFYLSPDQVKRGQMTTGQPYAWYVQASFGGKRAADGSPLFTALAVSAELRSPARLERFQALLDEQKDSRAGILLPQVETPFRDMYIDETPVIKGYKRYKK